MDKPKCILLNNRINTNKYKEKVISNHFTGLLKIINTGNREIINN